MNTLNLDEVLVFDDLQAGADYLARLSLANPAVAEQQLMRFLDALLAAPPAPGILLGLLEQARVPMCFVEEEMARRFHNKPLPLEGDDEAAFQQVVAAWRKIGKAYALCAQLEEPDTDNPQYHALMAMILHRCLYYTGMVMLEHYRARRELPPGVWLDLHGYYETAEEWGIATLPVQDALENSLQATHCAAAYATLLLIEIACPYSNNLRNLHLIRRWASLWAPLVSIHPLSNDLEAPAYVVELMKDGALHPVVPGADLGADARHLDTNHLGLQILHMLSQLRLHTTPSQLGLGEETSGHVIALLENLLRPWTQSASPRRFRRFPAEGVARLTSGFDAMYWCVTGQAVEQPDSASAYSRKDFDALFTFRERAEPGAALAIKPQVSFPVDEWTVINHSANGFRLIRSSAGLKMALGQLIAICPHDGEHFLLGHIIWLMQEEGGGLLAGVGTLPGKPGGVLVRVAAEGSDERYIPAFLLPDLPAIGEVASIVLPAGMYRASGDLELYLPADDSHRTLRMLHMLQRGADFDRVSYHLV